MARILSAQVARRNRHISVEAIQEFKATGSAFSAEYGRATGGVLNVTTKSGTNQSEAGPHEY